MRSSLMALAVMALAAAPVASATSPPFEMVVTAHVQDSDLVRPVGTYVDNTGAIPAPAILLQAAPGLGSSAAGNGSAVAETVSVINFTSHRVGASTRASPAELGASFADSYAGNNEPANWILDLRCTICREMTNFGIRRSAMKGRAVGDKFARPRSDILVGATARRTPMRV